MIKGIACLIKICMKKLEILCNNQQLEIEKLIKTNETNSKNDETDTNKSKSGIEQVLEEEYYDTDN